MRREPEQQKRGGIPPTPPAGRSPSPIPPTRREDLEHQRALQQERRSRLVKVLVALAIVVILIIFVVSNSQPVSVDFVFLTRHPRMIWVMLTCALLGGIAGYLIGRPGKQIRFHREKDEQPKK